jgi:hypothetical protein
MPLLVFQIAERGPMLAHGGEQLSRLKFLGRKNFNLENNGSLPTSIGLVYFMLAWYLNVHSKSNKIISSFLQLPNVNYQTIVSLDKLEKHFNIYFLENLSKMSPFFRRAE